VTTYPRALTGTARNGAERNKGRLVHAILSETAPGYPCFLTAVCGAVPGRTSAGWNEIDAPEVTCPKCQKRLAAIPKPAE
jgi:hypothetical protein